MPRHLPQIALLFFCQSWLGRHGIMLPAVATCRNAEGLAVLGGGPAGGAAVAVLQGAERLAEDFGDAVTRQVV